MSLNRSLSFSSMPSPKSRRRKHFSLRSLVSWSLVVPTFALWPFPPKRFTGNSLIAAGSMGLDGDVRVAAFGDFNGDQLYA